MARTIRRILFLCLLAAACAGGCFFPPDAQPPPVPAMTPGIWDANLAGVQRAFTRAIGVSRQLEDTIEYEQPVQIPIGAEFDDTGRLKSLRVLGGTGYVNLANPGDRIDEIDYWTGAGNEITDGLVFWPPPVARRHVLETVDYVDDKVTIRLSSSTETACRSDPRLRFPTEKHEYSFSRIIDRVSVSATLTSFTPTGDDGSGSGSTWVLGPTDAVARPDAPAPLVGLLAFNTHYVSLNHSPLDPLYFDRLGRLVVGSVTYPGDVTHLGRSGHVYGDFFITAISIAGDARVMRFCSAPLACRTTRTSARLHSR